MATSTSIIGIIDGGQERCVVLFAKFFVAQQPVSSERDVPVFALQSDVALRKCSDVGFYRGIVLLLATRVDTCRRTNRSYAN
jgi:hypothetical protein